ncbi:snRNA-activating protein complex subunit 2 [Nematolebias whitei]|uniref:snRNA-activating protein complex subunit 2 n=1 Tax=Nematolebias whitei TaxID=451745 RepID=UPI001898F688|nr:snRNA-activating protein complex subunit 2 [Nematolebias whitei]
MVDSLKTKLISGVSFQLQKIRWEEERSRKPVDEWTHLASALAGTLEVVLSAAFSQMLIVSSAEPCTLRNCDPFPVHRPPTSPTSLTHSPTDKVPATISLPLFLKTPAPTMGPARRLLAPCQVVRLPNRTCFSSQFASSSQTVSIWKGSSTGQARPGFSSVQATVKGGRSETSTLLSSPQTSLSPSPVPTSTPQSFSVLSRCPSTPPTFPPSSPTAAYHPRFGQSSKHATKDHLTAITVTSVVDFEKIYNFLSAVQNPSDDCHLTPMESAIVLDLLMSLPEELCLMDCTNLHRHMIQGPCTLSTPEQEAMQEYIKTSLQADIIRPSTSPAGVGFFFVGKKVDP